MNAGETTMMHAPSPSPSYLSHGSRLVAVDGRTLPLVATAIAADACGGLARVVVEQRFRNAHDVPLTVTYSLPLPPDAAVSAYAFRVGDRRVVGEIDRRASARERFEESVLEGKTAALLEQDRSSLFTQEIANVPPGGEVVAEVTIDQRLRFLSEGEWEWRFPRTVAPRYLGEEGRVPDAARLVQDMTEAPLPVRATLNLTVRDALSPGRAPESPSDRVRTEGGRVVFADEAGAPLDRDLVVRWAVAQVEFGVRVDVARPPASSDLAGDAFALLTVVPPRPDARPTPVPRDVVVLLDTSGSMSGEPLDQARRVVGALVDTLGTGDQLEMIEFSSSARRWKRTAVAANDAHRRGAHAWLAGLKASGSTEMREALIEALRPLRPESQRQVVLVTDGQIGFESEVIAEIASRLPQSSRVHTVGVGSAVNRTLTGTAARAGRGVEVVVGLGEDAERAAQRIVAGTDAPTVVDVTLEGSAVLEHAPRKLPDLFAGTPLIVAIRSRPEGGEVLVRGRLASGPWESRVRVPPTQPGEGSQAIVALFGREAVEDLEVDLAAGADAAVVDPKVEAIGLRYRISTRVTSWVAIAEEPSVDPREPIKRVRMPHALPDGLSAEGLGLRGAIYGAARAPIGSHVFHLGSLSAGPSAMATRTRSIDLSGLVSGGRRTRVDLDGSDPTRGPSTKGAPRQPSPKSKPTVEERAAERTLDAHVLMGRAGQIVVEVLVEGGNLDWIPPAEAKVVWRDGFVANLPLDLALSTREGVVKDGDSFRVILLGDRGAPLRIELTCGPVRLLLEL
jgi:Ca-activated chloride channel family protein